VEHTKKKLKVVYKCAQQKREALCSILEILKKCVTSEKVRKLNHRAGGSK